MNISSVSNNNFGANYSAVIKNQLGLHMAPSAAIVKITSTVDKPIFFSTKGVPERNVRSSIIGILGLEPTCGKELTVRVSDDYPKDVLKTILDCIGAGSDSELIQIFEKFKNKVGISG